MTSSLAPSVADPEQASREKGDPKTSKLADTKAGVCPRSPLDFLASTANRPPPVLTELQVMGPGPPTHASFILTSMLGFPQLSVGTAPHPLSPT